MVVSSEPPPIREPGGAPVVALLRSGERRIELRAPVAADSLPCAACGRELAPDGCFTLRPLPGAGPAPSPLCTFCEPIPAAAVIESLHLVHRLCAHPRCSHPALASSLHRFGEALEHARLEWVHERPLATWSPAAPVHRPRPGELLD